MEMQRAAKGRPLFSWLFVSFGQASTLENAGARPASARNALQSLPVHFMKSDTRLRSLMMPSGR